MNHPLISSSELASLLNWLQQADDPSLKQFRFAKVEAYWQIGKLIMEKKQQNNKHKTPRNQLLPFVFNFIKAHAATQKYGKQKIREMCQLYQAFPDIKQLHPQLSWSHYRQLMKVDYQPARLFYMEEAAKHHWSLRQLSRQLKALYFERTVEQQQLNKNETISNSQWKPDTWLKELYILEFLQLANQQNFLEKELENALLQKLQAFILELGQGFAFVARQKRIVTATGKTFYIDLVFYHFIKKCFVILELKVGKLSHRDIGQMDMYVRLADQKWRTEGDKPTIGIILCSEKDPSLLRYSVLHDSNQLFAATYQLNVPQADNLADKVQRLFDKFLPKE